MMAVTKIEAKLRMFSLLYQWIDVLWLPAGLLAVRRGQRLMTAALIITCIITLRTQIELMDSIHHGKGFLNLIHLGLFERGAIVYGFFIAIFLILAHLSPNTKGALFLAATLAIYILAFCASMLAMLL